MQRNSMDCFSTGLESSEVATSNLGNDSGGGLPGSKLRSSCDQCTSLKIRCGKQKPACERCGSLGLACHYSPYRWKGRPSSSTSLAVMAVPLSPAYMPMPASSQVQPPTPGALPTPNNTRHSSTPHSHSPPSASTINAGTAKHSASRESPFSTLDLFFDANFDVVTPTDLYEPQWESNSTLVASQCNFQGPPIDPSTTVLDGFTPSHGDETRVPRRLSSVSVPTTTPATDMQVLSSQSSAIAHRCVALVLDTLHALHATPLDSSPVDNEAAKSPSSGTATTRSLTTEQAIRINRHTIQTLIQMLARSCERCASDPSMDLLLYTVCARILSRYQSIFDSISQEHLPHSSTPFPATERLQFNPIEFGELPIDLPAARSLNAQLLVHELKNLAKLQGLITGRGSNALFQNRYQSRGESIDAAPRNSASPYWTVQDSFYQLLTTSIEALIKQIDTFCQGQRR
ncbi:hypothetical protein B0I35DRAFT_446075 [Stachybotrys elegans]|uniref:Zn(2)-C6 fungal-type domain-containing protein n=1 Tax=Stachybotrys elegans TaxID=80388 RepID=A0A8K0SDR2_9HYPO|nr:hypothetical protein B0I35DRAFT_446075 [Stachybotrys elegans]